MRLVWTLGARLDRLAILNFIANDNVTAAIALDELFDQKAILLMAMPSVGRKGRMAKTREWVVHPNYLLIYRVRLKDDLIEIVRVTRAAQQWP